MRRKRLIALLLALALLLAAPAGCGRKDPDSFRTLATIGTKRYCVITRAGDRAAPFVNAAMKALAASGTLAALSAQWLGENAISLEGDANALGALEMDEALVGRTLIVGVANELRPLAYTENGALRGLSCDIAAALGAALGWTVQLQPIGPDEVDAQLASGNIDCALGFDPTGLRASRFETGVEFMQSDIVVAVRQDSDVKSLKKLGGERIGTVNDPVVSAAIRGDAKVTKHASGATIYLSPGRCLAALDNGWCAAVAMDALTLRYAMTN